MAEFLTGRCNPYGHETGGPRHLLGGLYGPDHEGRQKWFCRNPATHRVRMHCRLYGHTGPVMEICDEHWPEIQRRMSGLCTRCAFPPEARAVQEEIQHAQELLQDLYVNRRLHWDDPLCAEQRRRIEAGKHRMDELWQSGRIQRVAMALEEVS
jgi:hypothetical protein